MKSMILNTFRAILIGAILLGCFCKLQYKPVSVDHGLVTKSILWNTAYWNKTFPRVGMAWFKEETVPTGKKEYYVKVYFRGKFTDGWKTCTATVHWRSSKRKTVIDPECGDLGTSFQDDSHFYYPHVDDN